MPDNLDTGLVIALIVAIGIAAQWFSWWVKQPAILVLLLAGLLAGPVLGLFDPDALFGDLLFPAVSLGVAVILFEGSLTLKFREIRGHGQVVTRLVTVGALVSMLLIALAAWALGIFSWKVALLFGALASRQVEDLLLAVEIFGAGIGLGMAAAFGLSFIMRRHVLPDYLHNVTTLAVVLLTFSLANALAHESGLLAVTVMGVILANTKDVNTDDILDFKESLTVLLTSVLFIVLAARVPASAFEMNWTITGALLGFIIFVARPVAVMISTIGSDLPWPERIVLSWIAPRGIVAAAVSALFAIELERAGVEGADILVPVTFAVIVVTVFVQGLTARPFARLMKVADPEARGVLILGGNPLAQAVALSLKKLDIDVILSDTSWDQIRKARMTRLKAPPRPRDAFSSRMT